MASEEVVEKLNTFFTTHTMISQECEAVYLMVQIRKILDHNRRAQESDLYSLLRFYCDWTVHTKKNRNTPSMVTIMNEVFRDAKEHIENPNRRGSMSPVMQFAYMERLRKEIRKCFEEHGINISITEGNSWISFVSILVKVLENQPIHNPTKNIHAFCFIPATDRCVQGIIYFTEPVCGYTYYKFSNVY